MLSSKTASVVAVVFAVVVAATGSMSAQTGSSTRWKFLGHWRLNAAKSDVKSSQLVVTGAPSGEMTVTLQGQTQTVRMDGKERPSTLGSTAIWTQTGPRSWRTVYRMAKADNNIDQYTLSADDKTLTMKTEFLVPKRSEQTLVFTRVSGGPGLLGVWKTETLQSDTYEFEMSSADANHVTIVWPTWGGTTVAPIDGTSVRVTGAPTAVAPGTSASFKLLAADRFDIQLKMDGTIISTSHFELSPDARTLTMDGVGGPSASGSDRVKLVFERR